MFFGFYSWIERHPTEAVLISLNYEPAPDRSDDAQLQEQLYSILTSSLAKKFWDQRRGEVNHNMPFFVASIMTVFSSEPWEKLEENSHLSSASISISSPATSPNESASTLILVIGLTMEQILNSHITQSVIKSLTFRITTRLRLHPMEIRPRVLTKSSKSSRATWSELRI